VELYATIFLPIVVEQTAEGFNEPAPQAKKLVSSLYASVVMKKLAPVVVYFAKVFARAAIGPFQTSTAYADGTVQVPPAVVHSVLPT
jgi:hypothetical protein